MTRIAVILGALWRLGKTALKSWTLLPIGTAVAVTLVFGVGEVVALLGGGLFGMLWLLGYDARASGVKAGLLLPLLAAPRAAGVVAWTAQAVSQEIPLWKLGLFFLKVSAVRNCCSLWKRLRAHRFPGGRPRAGLRLAH